MLKRTGPPTLCALLLALFLLPAPPTSGTEAPESPSETGEPSVPEHSITLPFPDLAPTLFSQILGIDEPPAVTISFPAGYDPDRPAPILCFIGGAHGGSGHSAAHARRIVGDLPFICISLPSYKADLAPLAEDESNKFSRQFISPDDARFIWKQYEPMLTAAYAAIPHADPALAFLGGFSNGANTTAALLSDPATRDGLQRFFHHYIFIEGGHRLQAPGRLPANAWYIAWGETGNGHLVRPIADLVASIGGRVTRREMKGVGHRFPEEEWPFLRAWLQAETTR